MHSALPTEISLPNPPTLQASRCVTVGRTLRSLRPLPSRLCFPRPRAGTAHVRCGWEKRHTFPGTQPACRCLTRPACWAHWGLERRLSAPLRGSQGQFLGTRSQTCPPGASCHCRVGSTTSPAAITPGLPPTPAFPSTCHSPAG